MKFRAAQARRAIGSSTGAWLAALWIGSGCSEAPDPPQPVARPTRVAVILGDPIPGLAEALDATFAGREFEAVVESGHGLATAQLEKVGRLLENGLALLAIAPVVPDVLFRVEAAAKAREVPVLDLLRGDGKSGPWVGIASTSRAREAGERAAAWLRDQKRDRPRVVVVEDPRWPETRRRVEATLQALESGCSEVHLALRANFEVSTDATAASLVKAIGRMGGADVLIAGDSATTAAAAKAARESVSAETMLLVGISEDPGLAEAARAPGSRLLLVHWKRDDLVQEVAVAIERLLADPAAAVTREVPTELLGLKASEAPAAPGGPSESR